jgi:hypothetical protein
MSVHTTGHRQTYSDTIIMGDFNTPLSLIDCSDLLSLLKKKKSRDIPQS